MFFPFRLSWDCGHYIFPLDVQNVPKRCREKRTEGAANSRIRRSICFAQAQSDALNVNPIAARKFRFKTRIESQQEPAEPSKLPKACRFQLTTTVKYTDITALLAVLVTETAAVVDPAGVPPLLPVPPPEPLGDALPLQPAPASNSANPKSATAGDQRR